MKPCKNQTLQFSLIFMTPDTWNLAKMGLYNFLQFSWPRVHETLQKWDFTIFSNFHDPGYMKPCKNQTLQFSPIFMTPGTWNLAKMGLYNFLYFSWPRVHETLKKLDASIFSDFHDLGYMKPCKNRTLPFSLIFMTPDTWNLEKIGCFNFSLIFMTPGTWNLAKIRLFHFL